MDFSVSSYRCSQVARSVFLSLQATASLRSYRSSFIFMETVDAGSPHQIRNYGKRGTVDYLIHPAFMRALIMIASHFLRDTLNPSGELSDDDHDCRSRPEL